MKLAHVGYVLSKSEFAAEKGGDASFLFSVLQDPVNIGLILVTAVVVFTGYYFFRRNETCRTFMVGLRKHEVDYRSLFPWIARLALGIAFIGAGAEQFLLTPAFASTPFLGFVQMAVGFLLLSGFMLFPALLLVGALFLIALLHDPYYIGNLDYLALIIVTLIWGSSRPGVDHLLGVSLPREWKKYSEYTNLILRLGVGVSMIYLAVFEKILHPHAMELVVSQYDLTSVVPVSLAMWVVATGVIEICIGAALLLGFKTRLVAAVALLVLTLSFFFFGEEVYSHVTLFGVLSILFIAGSGRVSIDEELGSEIC